MRRYTPAEQKRFRSCLKGDGLDDIDSGIYVAWPAGQNFVSEIDLTEEQMRKVGRLLTAMREFHLAERDLLESLPSGCSAQCFGDWNLLRIYGPKTDIETPGSD